uniref:Uncharacterized protein n=1 Tax=viral metagenome TaxID=1070528 RepID=A0A6C0LR57_9ZZZZ
MENNVETLIDSLLKKYESNLSTIFGSINNNGLIIFATIFVICFFFMKMTTISVTFIFFFFLAIFLSYLVYSKRKIIRITLEDEHKIKLGLIIPKPKRIDKYPDLIDFLYSIRDFYYINPTAFFQIIDNIDNFIQLYDEIMYDKVIYCTENIEVALEFIRNAQNHLHSIIYNLDVDTNITKKFHQSLVQLHRITQQYSSRIIRKCNSKFNSKNINNSSGIYEQYGPREFNYYDYDNANSHFEFY